LICIDITLPSPEENLALDEALLSACGETAAAGGPGGGEVLRFWESRTPFVVLGVSGKLLHEVDLDACKRCGIPVLRRASGGGTVLQGPGCLNFSLVLSLALRPELADLRKGTSSILERTARGLGLEALSLRGTSDLALGDRKISGNAQKRTRHALLHHGTLLHAMDPGAVGRCLPPPPKEPAYRAGRTHEEFLGNLPLTPEEIKARLRTAWGAAPTGPEWHPPPLQALIAEKYGNPAWIARF
jgi:lipoate-protein ligase A